VEPFVVEGPVRLVGAPLTSPFGGKTCAAYEYDVTRRIRGHKRDTTQYDFAGFAMSATAVETPHGLVRVVGFPLLDEFPKQQFADAGARQRAARYVASTIFERAKGVQALALFRSMDDALADADGIVRKDFRMTDDAGPNEQHVLSERIVTVGEHVCAAGIFDGELRALKPRGTSPNRLWPGALSSVRRRLIAETKTQVVMGLVLFGASHTLLGVGWYLSETRHSRESTQDQARVIAQAVDAHDIRALERAVRRGANANARDSFGTPVLLETRDAEMAAALLRLGADVNIRDNESGDTPLIRAARMGLGDLVEVLLSAGADVKAFTVSGDTPLSEARRGDHADVVARLLRAGAPDKPAAERAERMPSK
jgi:hypothetical protein